MRGAAARVVLVLLMGLLAREGLPGTGAAAFLHSGIDARALAMGGAYVALTDGYSAMYWNPAGLARTHSPELGGMVADLFGAGIYLSYLACVYPWQPGHPAQTRSEALTSSESARLAVGASFTQMSTEVRAYDERGTPVGLARYSEGLYSLGIGVSMPRLGSAGAAVKVYAFRAPQAGVAGADAAAFGVGVDVGIALPLSEELWLALSAADIGGSLLQWRSTPTEPAETVSARYTAGAAYLTTDLGSEGDRLVLALDAIVEPLTARRELRAGVEYAVDFLSLRGGIRFQEAVAPSFVAGLGVRLIQLSIDAAWIEQRTVETAPVLRTVVVSARFAF